MLNLKFKNKVIIKKVIFVFFEGFKFKNYYLSKWKESNLFLLKFLVVKFLDLKNFFILFVGFELLRFYKEYMFKLGIVFEVKCFFYYGLDDFLC